MKKKTDKLEIVYNKQEQLKHINVQYTMCMGNRITCLTKRNEKRKSKVKVHKYE